MDSKTIIPSTSSSQMIRKFHVFVSFRGEDTRHSFTDHLFAALHRGEILTFRDDIELKKGASIEPELLHAIEGSLVYIVVFSKNYAFSTWCLRELAKIVDCLKVSTKKRVLPVFYDVDPSEVRKQSGNYGKAFAEYEQRLDDLEMVPSWRGALTQVANLSGWDVRNKPQNAEIEKIVEEIISILGHKSSSLPHDLGGWDSPPDEIEKLLVLDSHESFQLDRKSGKKCYMLAAKALYIVWGDNPQFWKWKNLPESRFPQVAQLVCVYWLDIRGVINTNVLSPNTQYAAYLVYKMVDAYGFDCDPVELSVDIFGGQSSTKIVCLDLSLEERKLPVTLQGLQRPNLRGDGWLEIEMGEFFNSGLEDDDVHMKVLQTKDKPKRGLFIEGIEVRRKKGN